MRFEGALKEWNDDRGFGFVQPTQGGEAVFVHVKAFARGGRRPQAGDRVSFEVETGPKGKRAKNVAALTPPLQAPRRREPQGRRSSGSAPWGTATLFVLPAFLVLYVIVAILWRPPKTIALVYLAASVVTFFAYAFDKAAAKAGGSRTSEATLHLFAVAGGWPGALLAQQLLRHKSVKAEFRAAFWGTVVLNVAGFVALASPWGRELLRHGSP